MASALNFATSWRTKHSTSLCAAGMNKEIQEKLATLPSNIKNKCLAVDLGKVTNIRTYRRIVAEHFADLDIGVVCFNAGTV
jgi:hypothetical protein